jgi:hypothetical protein
MVSQSNTLLVTSKKVKQSRYTPWRRLGKKRYSSYSFTTSALDGGDWSASRPGRSLPPGKGPRYPFDRRLGGPQSRSEHRGRRKNPLLLPGIEPRSTVVQLVFRHYTTWANPAPLVTSLFLKLFGAVFFLTTSLDSADTLTSQPSGTADLLSKIISYDLIK